MAKELLASVYAETNMHAQAYEAQLHMLHLAQRLGKLEQVELVKNLEIQHEVRERQKDLERLQSENIRKEIDLIRQEKLHTALWVALILAIITIILTSRILSLRIFAQKLKAERNDIQREQEVQQILAESKLTHLNAVIQGQESERTRIAKDLHDGLGGLLSTVKIHFLTVQQEIESINKLLTFKKATHMLDDACEEVRRIAHNMMPDALDQLGLSAVILDLSQALEEKGYVVHTQLLNVEDRLPEELEINLYRIIQELVNNIIKYAEATQIIIQLSRDGDKIFLTVEDNGRGFDPITKYSGIGLQNIRSRVDFLSGEIDISSQPGDGTSVFISLPLK